MPNRHTTSQFDAALLRPVVSQGEEPWAFVVLPKRVSDTLPRRGRTTVEGSLNAQPFQATLEPDGRLSHWLRVKREWMDAAGVDVGDVVHFEIVSVEKEPEPDVPSDFREALEGDPEARAVWEKATALAHVDWIHWITSAKQAKTREKRIRGACEMLASGKRRVCCFDPSGYYSKAFGAPEAAK